jgi:hypothetical protein
MSDTNSSYVRTAAEKDAFDALEDTVESPTKLVGDTMSEG